MKYKLSEMINEKWKEKTLGEVTSLITKGIPPKYSEKENKTTIWVLNQKCNRNFEISYSEARLHDCSLKKVPENRMLKNGDVLINSTGTGTAGRVAQLHNVVMPTTIDGHMILLRPTDEIDSLYYGYAIKSFQKQIEALAEGSTGQTEINRQRLQNEVIIKFPIDKCKQRKISSFLSNLDKKIKVNIEINKNIAWITPKDLAGFSGRYISNGERNITEQGLKSCSAQLIPKHSILFSSRAPIGYIAIAANEVCTNQGFKSIVPNDSIDYLFLYYLLKYNKKKIESLGSGTTFKEVSGSTMKSIQVTIPETIEEQRKISTILSLIDDKIEENEKINKNLVV